MRIIVLIFLGYSGVVNGASNSALLQYSQCAMNTPFALTSSSSAAAEVYTFAAANFAASSMSVAWSMSMNITEVGSCTNNMNLGLYSLIPYFGANTIIAQLNSMSAIMNATNSTCAVVNGTAVTAVQSNITTISMQISQITSDVQSAGQGWLALWISLSSTTINTMTQMVQSYISVMNTLVVAWKNAVSQKPLMIYLYEVLLAFSQAAMNTALNGLIIFYNVSVVVYMNTLQIIIAAANVTCNSMNVTTATQINVTIVTLNTTMNGSAIFLPPSQQAAIANYTNLTISIMTQLIFELNINITYATANFTSFCGNNITAAMQNITQMGQNATINITQIMNSTSNRVVAVFCASISFEQIQLVIANASNYLGVCVTDGVKEMKNDTDECVKAYNDKSKNATNSISNCTKPGSHEKTDDEFKKCLEVSSNKIIILYTNDNKNSFLG